MKKRRFPCKHVAYWLGMLFFFLAQIPAAFSQQKVTLSGQIKDAANGETLIGATVLIKELGVGATTNPYGFYSLSVAPGTYTVEFRFIGYNTVTETLSLADNLRKDVELAEAGEELQEVTVTGEREDANVTNVEMSVNRMEMKTMQKLPALLGEVDLVRSIQLLPGVSTVGEGASGFNVRGGGVDQNLVLLDEAPVYNSSHLFGFFSVFNPDAVKDVKLIKGGIPAQYGGRLSSILDVRMKEGNSKELAVQGGVGAIFSRLTVEAPIVKDKASFIIAGRRSYADVLARPFLSGDLADSKFYFYDLTLKTNYRFSGKDQIFLSGYFGRDVFSAGAQARFLWGNATGTLRWNHLFNERLFFNLTTFYSNYDYSLGFGDDDRDRFDWKSKIINYSVKPEFTYFLNSKNQLTFGGQATLYDFEPGEAQLVSNGVFNDFSQDNKYAFEVGLYVGNEQTINSNITLQYGLRLSGFDYMGPGKVYEFGEVPLNTRRPVIGVSEVSRWETIQTFWNWEPRFSAKYQLNPAASIKASYNRMVQYLHLVSNSAASTPIDVWTPSTNNIDPQIGDQYALGYFRNFKNNAFETSIEVYYKDFRNLVEYIDGADLLLNSFLEGDLLSGIGRAYGVELYIKKNIGKFNGWISYTLSRTERKVDGINRSEWFPARFDQPHNLRLVAFYDLSPRWSISGNFVFASGTPTTFPTNRFEFQGYIVPHNVEDSRNNVRISPYHRLDLSATLQGKRKPGRKNEDSWVFSIYNVYGRRNPFSIYFQQNELNPRITEAERLSIIGTFVPAVSYNFKF